MMQMVHEDEENLFHAIYFFIDKQYTYKIRKNKESEFLLSW
jgi:hypothetical protein